MFPPRHTLPFRHLQCRRQLAARLYTDDTQERLRSVLRETAQSVAVVTTVLPDSSSPSTSDVYHNASKVLHGATLSSFSSVALDPHPLVAFSLRVPSRMAVALNAHHQQGPTSTNARAAADSGSSPHPESLSHAYMVINILSASQAHVAQIFARPDLHARPFEHPRVAWYASKEGLPVLRNSIGALTCRLVGRSLLLSGMGCLEGLGVEEKLGREDIQQVEGGSGLASELFIAQVLRVEELHSSEGASEDDLRTLPLLYHRRRYSTVQDLSGEEDYS